MNISTLDLALNSSAYTNIEYSFSNVFYIRKHFSINIQHLQNDICEFQPSHFVSLEQTDLVVLELLKLMVKAQFYCSARVT